MAVNLKSLSKEVVEVKCSTPACGKVFRDTRRNIEHRSQLYCTLACANAANVVFGGALPFAGIQDDVRPD